LPNFRTNNIATPPPKPTSPPMFVPKPWSIKQPTTPPKPHETLMVLWKDTLSPTIRVMSAYPEQTVTRTLPAAIARLPGSLPARTPNRLAKGTSFKLSANSAATFVDRWVNDLNDNLEGAFPPNDPRNHCEVRTNPTNEPQPRWDKNSYRKFSGANAIWPASAGAGSVTPPTNYPADFETWLLCGPYNLSSSENFMVRFKHWYNIWGDTNSGDTIFVGISTDSAVTEGSYFFGKEWTGPTNSGDQWLDQTIFFPQVAGYQNVWVAWKFTSKSASQGAPGWWIDDLEIWHYDEPTPVNSCADQDWSYEDKGYKSLGFLPYEKNVPAGTPWAPIIRVDVTTSLQHLVDSDVKWVRLPFVRDWWGILNYQDYDRIIDSLCTSGISVLGLLDNETLPYGQDMWDSENDAIAASYRFQFTARASALAQYFRTRIKYWEVWNEPDGGDTAIDGLRFTKLVDESNNAIKAVNPNAQVILGGVGSAWNTGGYGYIESLYAIFTNNPPYTRPFDKMAIHPYYDYNHEYAPTGYFYDDLNGVGPTIFNKFINIIGDDNKPIWITELGWNANQGANIENRPYGCTHPTVTRMLQAIYLKQGFDITLANKPNSSEPLLQLNNGQRAIEKVFWFGYRDFSVLDKCTYQGGTYDSAEWWGLYDALSINAQQPTQCIFKNYPSWGDCIDWKYIYLPIIIGNEPPQTRTK
jgi:hypothetical protein